MFRGKAGMSGSPTVYDSNMWMRGCLWVRGLPKVVELLDERVLMGFLEGGEANNTGLYEA